MTERGLRTKINPIDDACDLKLYECNHKYQYIATERIPTDNWNYGWREYKEEIIVYCPICHTHNRMSKEEWMNYHGLAASLNRKLEDLEMPVCAFSGDKVATFEVKNSFYNRELIWDILGLNKEKQNEM